MADGKNLAYPHGTIKYSIDINWQTLNPHLFKNYIVGGLRIKKIENFDGINSIPAKVKTYQYISSNDSTISSGWLDFQPVYSYLLGINVAGSNPYTNTFFTQTSISNYPLATSHGSVVGYSHIEERDDSNGQNGKTEYFYNNSQTTPDITTNLQLSSTAIYDFGFPFSPPNDHDWKRGLLLKKTIWKSSGSNSYAKVQNMDYKYSSSYSTKMVNIKVGFTTKPALYNKNGLYLNSYSSDGVISAVEYADSTDFTYLSKETTTNYYSNDSTQIVNNYQYDTNNFLISNITSVNSKNEKVIQNVTYPCDYNTTGFTGAASMTGLAMLNASGISSYPVEEVTQRSNTDGTNLRTVKAVLTTYKPTMPVRDSVYEMQSVTPVTSFVNSTSGTTYIAKDGHYQPLVNFQKYDAHGNILQESKIGGPVHSYIWGYPDQYSPNFINSYPIAEVVNADTSSIAYTNFEGFSVSGTGYGNWNYNGAGAAQDATAPMGSGCYQLSNGSINKGNLTLGANYTLSLWSKSGAAVTISGGTITSKPAGTTLNGWTYHEYNITGATTVIVGGAGLIDELRLYPVNAQMSSYTYLPLVGISSSCSTKGEFTYYLYDLFGRLIDVKDQYGNILKHTDYHYQGY